MIRTNTFSTGQCFRVMLLQCCGDMLVSRRPIILHPVLVNTLRLGALPARLIPRQNRIYERSYISDGPARLRYLQSSTGATVVSRD